MENAEDWRAASEESKEDLENGLNQAADAIVFDGQFDPGKELFKLKEEKDAVDYSDEKAKVAFFDKFLDYKAKLRAQREGINKIVNTLFDTIKSNPDISVQELSQIVDTQGKAIGLNYYQKSSFEQGIRNYLDKHRLVQEQRQKYTDQELFEALSGHMPEGEIKVKTLPANFNIICSNSNDFNKLYGDEEDASMSGGFSYKESYGLRGVVTVSRYDYKPTEDHEEQHKFHQLFTVYNTDKLYQNDKVIENLDADSQIFLVEKSILNQYLISSGIDNRIKDELLAYVKGMSNSVEIKETMHSKLYDYMDIQSDKKGIRDVIYSFSDTVSRINDDNVEGRTLSSPDDQTLMQDIENLYNIQLDKWIKCIGVLEEKHYLKSEIVNMLYIDSIWNWPNVVNRAKNMHQP
ncbi:MAG: hypothetical protein WC227_00955 [Patescibacteria group bacterium]